MDADDETMRLPRGVARTKRALDILGALTGLVLGTPAVLLAAVALKIESAEPVLETQLCSGVQRRRPGSCRRGERRVHDAGGRLFRRPRLRLRRAPSGRLTVVSSWIQASGLASWPALWSVLTGRMSLVGPRPVSPRWQTRLNEEVPLYAATMLDVPPGLWSPGRAHGGPAGSLVCLSVERVLHDLPYARRLKAVRGVWPALSLDLGVLWACLRRQARARRLAGNEVVRIEYPNRFEQLAVDPRELARDTPRDMGSEVHEAAGRITAWWYPKRAGGADLDPAGDAAGREFTAAWCDARHALAPREVVLTKELQPAPGGEDAIRVELPAGLHGIHGLCEHLVGIWEPLQWRSIEPHFALRQNLLLLEGLFELARSAGSSHDRLAVDVHVGPSGVRSRLQRLAPPLQRNVSVSGLFVAAPIV